MALERIKGLHALHKKEGYGVLTRKERGFYESKKEFMKSKRAINKAMKKKYFKKGTTSPEKKWKEWKLRRGDWGYVDIRPSQEKQLTPSFVDPYNNGGLIQHD